MRLMYYGRGCLRYGTEVLDLERREANIHVRPRTFCTVAHITPKEVRVLFGFAHDRNGKTFGTQASDMEACGLKKTSVIRLVMTMLCALPHADGELFGAGRGFFKALPGSTDKKT